MRNPRIERKPVEYAKALLELGLTLKEVSAKTGYDPGTLSHMALAWGLQRPRGRKAKASNS